MRGVQLGWKNFLVSITDGKELSEFDSNTFERKNRWTNMNYKFIMMAK